MQSLYASYASALASDTPKVSTSETGNTSGTDILYQDTDGGQISVDGKNSVAEADYRKTIRYRMCSGGQLMNMRRG